MFNMHCICLVLCDVLTNTPAEQTVMAGGGGGGAWYDLVNTMCLNCSGFVKTTTIVAMNKNGILQLW